MVKRSECQCICHKSYGHVGHVVACCEPDSPAQPAGYVLRLNQEEIVQMTYILAFFLEKRRSYPCDHQAEVLAQGLLYGMPFEARKEVNRYHGYKLETEESGDGSLL